jgi:hypothetical protein
LLTRIEKTLSGPSFFLRRFDLYRSARDDRPLASSASVSVRPRDAIPQAFPIR